MSGMGRRKPGAFYYGYTVNYLPHYLLQIPTYRKILQTAWQANVVGTEDYSPTTGLRYEKYLR